MSTPVQRQYWELKKAHKDAMLFFRLGDFYELFYEDAQIASKLLSIALTARHKGTDNEMPMCGFPYHAHSEYLEKLVEAGYKVAVAEQHEQADGKILRKVDRVITPGTTLEQGNLDPGKNNFLLAIDHDPKLRTWALGYVDLSTGEFRVASFVDQAAFWEEVGRIAPREILLPKVLFDDTAVYDACGDVFVTPREKASVGSCAKVLQDHFSVASLESFGLEGDPLLLSVAGGLLSYLQETQKTDLSHITKVVPYRTDESMLVDRQTFQHLEIFQPQYAHQKGGTLLEVFDMPLTALGRRRLRAFLRAPLVHREKLLSRQSVVEALVMDTGLRQGLESCFRGMPDFERLLSRLSTGRGNARDMIMIRDGLGVFPEIAKVLQKSSLKALSLKSDLFEGFAELEDMLERSLSDQPPYEITEGGIFCEGFSEKLDALRDLARSAQTWMDDFLAKAKEDTGISSLRMKYSKNFGFCLEVTKSHMDRVPEHWVRRQTLVNAERFTTPELSEHEEKVLSSQSESYQLEYELFVDLRNRLLGYLEPLQRVSQGMAFLDACLSMSRTAVRRRWCRPEITGERGDFIVQEARHPVVEMVLDQPFIANDLSLSQDQCLHIITGPNMAGKSTFLRQNALLIFLAQTGSFVPAKKVQMPIFDRIFTRIGASDHLAGGKSTFYVEMAETAHILQQVTPRSFVILDEIGRGTSTFDGLSLAWAITEYLHHEIGAKTLLATHYHELIDLGETLKHAANYHVSVAQKEDGVTFLHKIKKGGIADSFGIEVAKTAGIPASVIEGAQAILERLESGSLVEAPPTLFTLRESKQEDKQPSLLEKQLRDIQPDEMSPKEALECLYELRKGLGDLEKE